MQFRGVTLELEKEPHVACLGTNPCRIDQLFPNFSLLQCVPDTPGHPPQFVVLGHAKFVRIFGGHIRCVDETLWEDSETLRNLVPSPIPFEVNCDEETWLQLEIVHRGGPFPSDFRDLFELLAVTVQLQLNELTLLCLKYIFGNPDFWNYYYPSTTPHEIVLMCFRESLNRLYRTDAVYQRESGSLLWRFGHQLEPSVTHELNSKIEEFVELGLDPVPIYFWCPRVPIMIMKRRAKPETAICDSKCKPIELFGKHFDLSAVDIDAFYLKYASYLLYKSGEGVYLKDLRCGIKAVQCFDNCKFFISREDTVMIVIKEKSEYHIRMWIDHGEYGRSSAVVYSTSEEIKSVDCDSNGAFLILKESGFLLMADPCDSGLVFADFGEGYHSAWFHGGDLYTLSLEEGQSNDFKMNRFKRVSAARWKELTEFSERRSLEEFAKGGRIVSIGQELYRFTGNGLEQYLGSGSSILILTSEEYVALSELQLHP